MLDHTTFQERVRAWAEMCFGENVADDKLERADRLVEELYELLQWAGYPRDRLAALERYTWDRPVGIGAQEVGGVMTTLAAFCAAHGLNMHTCGEAELNRIWAKADVIRAKQAAKPSGSALPIACPTPPEVVRD